MEKENIGVFSVEQNAENNKYVIVYIEKGEKLVLKGEDSTFDSYDAADEFLKTHEEELYERVTEIKNSLEQEENKEEESEEENKEEKSEENQEEDKEETEENKEKKDKKKKSGWFIKFLSGFLAAVIMLVGGHFAAKGISSAIRNSKDDSYVSSEQEETNEKEDPDLDQEQIVVEEELTTEEFEKITAKFTKLYTDNNLNISTEDLVKFVSIVNIDKLVEDNPELASQLFANQSKEEYINDAAKVIGLTYTYNRNVYKETGSTNGFIKISDSVSGKQKHVLQTIEAYLDLIATYSYDAEQANLYISALINDLGDPTSSLSYLDDGIGFGMQVYIELIRSCIAKDVISQKNLDALTLMTSAEEYISNIFTVYDKCNSSYTKTK